MAPGSTDIGVGSGVAEIDPSGAYEALSEGGAILIDVRTRAEWSFVGLPDLGALGTEPILIEWQGFPPAGPNPDFAAEALVAAERAGAETVYFLCRSGARSLNAARATAAAAETVGRALRCVNVAEGFEGDLDSNGRRGALNGWKARGLPWRQS